MVYRLAFPCSMKVSPETIKRMTQDIVEDRAGLLRMGNLMWKSCIAEGLTPKEFREKGLLPRPDSIETFMVTMVAGFNAQAAAETKAVLQFNFSGEKKGACYLKIENGTIDAQAGTADGPDLIIDTPFDVWMDVITGKASGQKMFILRKYKVKGDLSLLMRMGKLFGR